MDRVPVVRRSVIAVLVAASVVVAACGGGGDPTDSETQPVPGASEFQEGDFDQLPLFRGAEAVDEPAVEGDVTSQSFTVDAATPEQVMTFYDRELEQDGWRVVDEPERLGAEETHRGIWQTDDQQLVVSATEFTGTGEPEDDAANRGTTQFSLSLGPA
jgi:hypothetical protein